MPSTGLDEVLVDHVNFNIFLSVIIVVLVEVVVKPPAMEELSEACTSIPAESIAGMSAIAVESSMNIPPASLPSITVVVRSSFVLNSYLTTDIEHVTSV